MKERKFTIASTVPGRVYEVTVKPVYACDCPQFTEFYELPSNAGKEQTCKHVETLKRELDLTE